ncbi:hypothetical protein CSKR_100259 [Clonorchis sinensis]|uniref:Uncharacterized protein n=1 Tax=Clonorchis sinensis TaxID=79923 RepID=A0A3R7BZD9_CLOSI|nr:hypothetical protein CSKR_100259 [Clonorchis sinensis]
MLQEVFIIIIGSMASVFNTDASLTYNHDFFESLIVKKRIKPGVMGIMRPHPGRRISPTAHKRFVISFIPPFMSRVSHLSSSATLNWTRKTALSSANDGSACATRILTNAACGDVHILQRESPLPRFGLLSRIQSPGFCLGYGCRNRLTLIETIWIESDNPNAIYID